jgi:hypothetical protein
MPSIFDGFNLSDDVRQFKSSTGQSVNTVKGNVLNPIDVTTERLDAGMAIRNDNDTSVQGTITAYRSNVVEALDGVIGALSGGMLNTKAITKAIRIDENGVRLDTDALISSAAGALGYNVYGANGAMQDFAKGINDELNRMTGLNFYQLIKSDGNGKFSVNGNWRSQAGMQTLDFFRKLTGMDEFVDVSVKTALYNKVLYDSSLFGMRDGYGDLWKNYPYMGLRQDAFIEAMRYMITNGDIESIDEVMKLLDEQGKFSLLNKYPDFVKTLFAKFRFASDVWPEDYPALRAKLMAILEIVAGPEWWMRQTQFGKAYNLGLTTGISRDMVTLLSDVPELIPLLATKGMFSEGSATRVLNNAFPDAPVDYL